MTKPWPTVRLGDVLHQHDNSVPVKQLTEINLAGVYSFAKGLFVRGPMYPTETTYKFYNRLVANDFVISSPKAWEGALARVTPEFDGWFLSPVFPTFRADDKRLLSEYLEWYCRRAPVWRELRRKSRGLGARRESVHPDQFLSLEIPLPSIGEQRRIVACIHKLASEINEARSLRQKAAAEAEALQTSARRKIITEAPGGSIALESVCAEIIDNLHSNPRLSASGVPCVRSPDVGYGTLDLERAQRTSEDEYRHRTSRGQPRADDIVFVREGGGTGKCALVLPGQRFSLGQRVMMLRPDPSRISPAFFLHQLLSPLVQDDQIAPLSKGSASPHLNISSLRKFRLKVPALATQRQIVAELDGIKGEIDNLKQLQAETAAELDALLPSILDHAFRGEL